MPGPVHGVNPSEALCCASIVLLIGIVLGAVMAWRRH